MKIAEPEGSSSSGSPFVELLEAPQTEMPQLHDGAARDAYLAGRLATAYALSEQLAPFRLRVDVTGGVVTLSGVVDDKVLRDLAIQIAEDLDAVSEVHSEIAVEAGAPHRDGDGFAHRFDNANLCARVRTRLAWNGATHNADIAVSADNGTITLSGTVASKEVRSLAEQLAADVRGTVHVDNRLLVRTEN
jgi:hyperosmotically inducible protein